MVSIQLIEYLLCTPCHKKSKLPRKHCRPPINQWDCCQSPLRADAEFLMVTRPPHGQCLGSQRARGPQEVRESGRPERGRSSTQHERRVLARHGRRPGIRHSHHLSCGHVAIPTMGIQKICRSRSVNFFYSYLFTFIHSIICDASCKSNLAWYLCSLLKKYVLP